MRMLRILLVALAVVLVATRPIGLRSSVDGERISKVAVEVLADGRIQFGDLGPLDLNALKDRQALEDALRPTTRAMRHDEFLLKKEVHLYGRDWMRLHLAQAAPVKAVARLMRDLAWHEIGLSKFAIEPAPGSGDPLLFVSQPRVTFDMGLSVSDTEPPTSFGVITDVYSEDCGLRFALTPYGNYRKSIVASSPEAVLAKAAEVANEALLAEAKANHLLECSPEAKARDLVQAMIGFSKGQAPFVWTLSMQAPDYKEWPGVEDLEEASEAPEPDLAEL